MTTAEHDSSTGGNEHPLSDNIWDSFSAFPQILIFFAYPAEDCELGPRKKMRLVAGNSYPSCEPGLPVAHL